MYFCRRLFIAHMVLKCSLGHHRSEKGYHHGNSFVTLRTCLHLVHLRPDRLLLFSRHREVSLISLAVSFHFLNINQQVALHIFRKYSIVVVLLPETNRSIDWALQIENVGHEPRVKELAQISR